METDKTYKTKWFKIFLAYSGLASIGLTELFIYTKYLKTVFWIDIETKVKGLLAENTFKQKNHKRIEQ